MKVNNWLFWRKGLGVAMILYAKKMSCGGVVTGMASLESGDVFVNLSVITRFSELYEVMNHEVLHIAIGKIREFRVFDVEPAIEKMCRWVYEVKT